MLTLSFLLHLVKNELQAAYEDWPGLIQTFNHYATMHKTPEGEKDGEKAAKLQLLVLPVQRGHRLARSRREAKLVLLSKPAPRSICFATSARILEARVHFVTFV